MRTGRKKTSHCIRVQGLAYIFDQKAAQLVDIPRKIELVRFFETQRKRILQVKNLFLKTIKVKLLVVTRTLSLSKGALNGPASVQSRPHST